MNAIKYKRLCLHDTVLDDGAIIRRGGEYITGPVKRRMVALYDEEGRDRWRVPCEVFDQGSARLA